MSSIKLTFRSIYNLAEQLPRLDAYMKDGIPQPFDFDENTRWNIGKNLKVVTAARQDAIDRVTAKTRELSPKAGKISEETVEIRNAYADWEKDFLNTEVEVTGILMLKRSKVYANKNPIPGTVTSALMDIMEDDGAPAAAPEKKS